MVTDFFVSDVYAYYLINKGHKVGGIMLLKEKTGLIVVDIQGKLATLVQDSELVIDNCRRLIKGAKALDLPILWLEQNPEKLGNTIPDISECLAPLQPISKTSFNACLVSEVQKQLQAYDIEHWILCGIEAHICVYQTALGLKALGFGAEVAVDCISSRTIENKELAVLKLMSKGVGITTVEMCLFEITVDCQVDEFKTVLSLVR